MISKFPMTGYRNTRYSMPSTALVSLFLHQPMRKFHLSECCHLVVLLRVTWSTLNWFFSLSSYVNCFFDLSANFTQKKNLSKMVTMATKVWLNPSLSLTPRVLRQSDYYYYYYYYYSCYIKPSREQCKCCQNFPLNFLLWKLTFWVTTITIPPGGGGAGNVVTMMTVTITVYVRPVPSVFSFRTKIKNRKCIKPMAATGENSVCRRTDNANGTYCRMSLYTSCFLLGFLSLSICSSKF
jgi:hypothetical protein